MTIDYDAIIIGTGQAGPPLAARPRRRRPESGRDRAPGGSGGTCVNNGCIPTKTMVASAYAAHLARRGAEYGVVPTGPVTVDMARVKARKDGVVGKSRHGVETWMRELNHGTVYLGHARFEGPDTVRRERHRAARRQDLHQRGRTRIGAADAGAGPGGLPDQRRHDARGESLPRHLLVVGGSYIGLEFGQMFRRFGSEVTIVQRGPRLIRAGRTPMCPTPCAISSPPRASARAWTPSASNWSSAAARSR
ncbi:FAD-dependent oxidoreductase [Cupriavidus basilensis]